MNMKSMLCAAAFTVLSSPAAAHHGWSAYDAGKAVKIEAPLVEVQYRNPHAEVVVEYQGNRWDVILAPTRRMESRGLPDKALTAGKTVIIEGYPRRDGVHEIRAERITVDGKTIELR
ncbi:DUF6152 family protein [Pusillimonas sp. SM2304]|uniref:DUF6152 family protein n=1 Tax=Pusillimonas sp. SM2304 TaxID=3073241 RepID=UPI00287470BB|nr:DUF6152 family protein [Pusillimonas sp. SM2304]MDS1141034.1 DUF6152 family protein [Pusillimonas sp. SM2304]